MEVYKPGTKVKILCPDGNKIEAFIDCVSIGYNFVVTYKLVWYCGNDRKENGFYLSEFEVNANEYKQKVGFYAN